MKTYDVKCYDLAQVFLADIDCSNHWCVDRLALVIQNAIEDEIGSRARHEGQHGSDAAAPEEARDGE